MNIVDIYSRFRQCGSVTTDTRTLKGGEMFFALKGENFDGNTYYVQALENGAIGCIIEESYENNINVEKIEDKSNAFLQVFFGECCDFLAGSMV